MAFLPGNLSNAAHDDMIALSRFLVVDLILLLAVVVASRFLECSRSAGFDEGRGVVIGGVGGRLDSRDEFGRSFDYLHSDSEFI